MPEKCILLEDKPAHRGHISKSNSLTNVLKGSLLVELTEREANETRKYFTTPLNYKKYSDDLVKLYCEPEYVLQLNDEQFNLLLGVKYPLDRYKALGILHWAEKLKVGNEANVTIPIIPHPVRGIARYIGSLAGVEGTAFGIELLVSQYVLLLC